jgi:hypothetical protein
LLKKSFSQIFLHFLSESSAFWLKVKFALLGSSHLNCPNRPDFKEMTAVAVVAGLFENFFLSIMNHDKSY